MKHTETQIRAMVIKMMGDLDVTYHADSIQVSYRLGEKIMWTGEVRDCWSVGVGVPDFRNRPGGDVVVITIDDETGEVLTYMDAPGRPIPGTLKLNSQGRYVRAALGL